MGRRSLPSLRSLRTSLTSRVNLRIRICGTHTPSSTYPDRRWTLVGSVLFSSCTKRIIDSSAAHYFPLPPCRIWVTSWGELMGEFLLGW